jgi:hypothetical protein
VAPGSYAPRLPRRAMVARRRSSDGGGGSSLVHSLPPPPLDGRHRRPDGGGAATVQLPSPFSPSPGGWVGARKPGPSATSARSVRALRRWIWRRGQTNGMSRML